MKWLSQVSVHWWDIAIAVMNRGFQIIRIIDSVDLVSVS